MYPKEHTDKSMPILVLFVLKVSLNTGTNIPLVLSTIAITAIIININIVMAKL